MNQREIDRVSFRKVPETCPKVDAALEAAAEAIKAQTGNLRDALNEYIETNAELEEQLEDALSKIKELESEVADLQKEIKLMEAA